jgi:hypothetical protein
MNLAKLAGMRGVRMRVTVKFGLFHGRQYFFVACRVSGIARVRLGQTYRKTSLAPRRNGAFTAAWADMIVCDV